MANRVVWAGRYAVFDEIASGGMASVYLACRLDGAATRVVAIKKMFESFAKRPEFVTMFLDEAHIAARIRHPNVVTTFEFLRIPDSLGIVMEFVLGLSLDNLLGVARDHGVTPPLGVTVSIVRDALLGLHAAHETKDDRGALVGLVHRDVSPHNVIVSRDGVAKVIDFGIAKAAGRLQVTEVGVMKGKFGYMAPEQIRAADVDRRVDIYSAGIVLWEAVTGQPLFQGTTDIDLFTKRGAGEVSAPPASTIKGDVPPALDAVIRKALEIDVGDRFLTAEAMATALLAAVPAAPRADVSEWVQRLAGSRLRELEAKRNEVETAHAAGELAGLVVTAPSASAPPAAAEPPPSVAPAAAPPLVLDIPDLAPIPQKAAPPKPAAAKPPPSVRKPPPPPSADAYDDAFGDAMGAPMNLDLAVKSAPRPSMHDARISQSSMHDARGHVREARDEAQAARRGGGAGLVLVLLVLAGAGAAYVFGPAYLRDAVASAAARRGLSLTADAIAPRSGGFTLSGVTVGLAGVDGVVAKASEVTVDLDWQANVRSVVVPGYELTIHGRASEVASRVAAWRAAPHLPVSFAAKAGHLVWSDLLVPGVQAEGIDVSLQLGAAEDGSISIDAPSFGLSMPRGTAGPWRAHLDATAAETKLTVSLDRSKQDGPPSVLVVSRPSLGTVVTATIPRARVVQIGVPADFFLAGSDPEIDLSLEAQAMPTGEPVSAHVTLALFAAIAGAGTPASQPVDLVLEGNIAGDSAQPLRIEPGALTVGKVKTRMTGVVTISPDRIRVEVDRPGRTTALAPFVLDTRDWTSPKDPAAAKPVPPAPGPTPASSASASTGRPRR